MSAPFLATAKSHFVAFPPPLLLPPAFCPKSTAIPLRFPLIFPLPSRLSSPLSPQPLDSLPEHPEVGPTEEGLLVIRRQLASAWRYSPYFITNRRSSSCRGIVHPGAAGSSSGDSLSSGLGTAWKRPGPGGTMGVSGSGARGISALDGRKGNPGASPVSAVESARRAQMSGVMHLSVAHFPAELLGPGSALPCMELHFQSRIS